MNLADDPIVAPEPSLHRGRKGLATGLVVGLLAGSAAGLVFGVPGLTSASSSDVTAQVEPSTDDVPTPDELVEELETHSTDALREELQALVDDGTITAEQADAVAEHLVGSVFQRAETWLTEHGIDLGDLQLGDWDLGSLEERLKERFGELKLGELTLGELDLEDLEARLGELRERFESGEFGNFGPGRHGGWPSEPPAPSTTTED